MIRWAGVGTQADRNARSSLRHLCMGSAAPNVTCAVAAVLLLIAGLAGESGAR